MNPDNTREAIISALSCIGLCFGLVVLVSSLNQRRFLDGNKGLEKST